MLEEEQDVQLFHGQPLGAGSYGQACKAKFCELPCAAKIIHTILFDDPQSQIIRRGFEQECELLKAIRHPNLVQYLGVTLDPASESPVVYARAQSIQSTLSEELVREQQQTVQELQHAVQPLQNGISDNKRPSNKILPQTQKNKEVELHEVSRLGLLERIPVLLESVSVDAADPDGQTPLFAASFIGHQKVVKHLLAAGANPNLQKNDGWTPLHAASLKGHNRVVHLLLEAGASVEQEAKDGQTALYVASRKGHDDVVELLLTREADVSHQMKDGATPLWTASFHGNQKVVKHLLAAGANPCRQNEVGFAALHVASFNGHHRVVEMLLQAGANVEQETGDGQTALFLASRNGHAQVAKLLLRREADVSHHTKWGTPLSIARSEGHEHIVQLLALLGSRG